MIFLTILMILLFLGLSLYLLQGEGGFLIAGYKTRSAEEKAEIDEESLCDFMGKMMIAITVCFIISLIGEIVNIDPLMYAGYLLSIPILIFMNISTNGYQRIKKKREGPPSRHPQ